MPGGSLLPRQTSPPITSHIESENAPRMENGTAFVMNSCGVYRKLCVTWSYYFPFFFFPLKNRFDVKYFFFTPSHLDPLISIVHKGSVTVGVDDCWDGH